jgi:hypothetical protein
MPFLSWGCLAGLQCREASPAPDPAGIYSGRSTMALEHAPPPHPVQEELGVQVKFSSPLLPDLPWWVEPEHRYLGFSLATQF